MATPQIFFLKFLYFILLKPVSLYPHGCCTFFQNPREQIYPPASLQSFRYLMTRNPLALWDLPCSRLNTASSFHLLSIKCSWHLPHPTAQAQDFFLPYSFLLNRTYFGGSSTFFLQASHSSFWAQGTWLWSG